MLLIARALAQIFWIVFLTMSLRANAKWQNWQTNLVLEPFKGSKEKRLPWLNGTDSLINQQTGSGKSLCYQFPPVYTQTKAVIICPTISLM